MIKTDIKVSAIMKEDRWLNCAGDIKCIENKTKKRRIDQNNIIQKFAQIQIQTPQKKEKPTLSISDTESSNSSLKSNSLESYKSSEHRLQLNKLNEPV